MDIRLYRFAAALIARTRPAASLSPLCGAQHAESGKEVAIAGLTRYSMWSNSTAHGMDSSPDGQWVSYDDLKEALATQQAAAARDVLAERQRQVEQEGWTAERDDNYTNCELARAAATYATCSHIEQLKIVGEIAWPWHPDWFKRSTYRRDLVKAGALVLAEIERLDRIAAPKGGA